MLRRLLPIFACTLAIGCLLQPAQASDTARWLLVSDIHFDPFADSKLVEHLAAAPPERWRAIFASVRNQPLSGYGGDTNYALLESAIDAMKSRVSDPESVVISGNFLAQSFRARFNASVAQHDDAAYDAFVDKTIAFLAQEFKQAFPRARVFPVIGDNDGYCGDYASEPGDPFLAHMAQAWAPLVDDPSPSGFAAQFPKGGYYALTLPDERVQLIVLNDIYWSAGYHNTCGDAKADPGGDELTWLTAQIKAAPNGEQTWIVGHTPPGIDVYATLHAQPAGSVITLLADRFNAPYVSLLEDPGSRIGFTIAGHLHMNGFRLIGSPNSNYAVPMLVIPSLSPIFANNPSFDAIEIDRATSIVTDQQVFVLDDLAALAKEPRRTPHWRLEYDFDRTFGTESFGAQSLSALHTAMVSDPEIRRRYDRFSDGESGRAPITEATWRAYWCGDVAMTIPAYLACAMPEIQTRDLPPQPTPPPAPPTPTSSPSPTASPSPTPSPTPRSPR